MKRQRRNELMNILSQLGIDCASLSDSGRHIRIAFAHNGRDHLYFAGSTPGDWRANRNLKSELRRLMRSA